MNRSSRWLRLVSQIIVLVVLMQHAVLTVGSAQKVPIMLDEKPLLLPLVQKGVAGPSVVTLAVIENNDLNGTYTLSWSEDPVRVSDWYLVQESTDILFTMSVRSAPTTAQTISVADLANGIYYYRVQALQNGIWDGPWSNIRSVRVLECIPLPYNELLLYNMNKVQAPQAWPCSVGGASVVIAILDTGADSDHPDLQANLVAGTYFTGASTEDDQGHGTHVSGIAAGVANNGGIVGVAPRASIMPVKVLNSGGSGTWVTIANGIIWAADHGAKVINMSLSGTTDSATLHSAVQYAYNKSVAIIAAAGNCGDGYYPYNGCSSMNQTAYPGAYPEVLAVAATDASDAKASFSTAGSYVDVAAPGVDIFSSNFGGGYIYHSGTSQAAPHVAGLAALIRELRPAWTVDQVYAQIKASVDDVGAAGYDIGTGWGRINAQKAVNTVGLAAADALPVPAPVQSTLVTVSSDPAEFSPGVVLFKLRSGVALSSVLGEAGIASAGLQASAAVAVLDVMQLQVPAGEELYWLKYLRLLPDVSYAELDGIMHIQ